MFTLIIIKACPCYFAHYENAMYRGGGVVYLINYCRGMDVWVMKMIATHNNRCHIPIKGAALYIGVFHQHEKKKTGCARGNLSEMTRSKCFCQVARKLQTPTLATTQKKVRSTAAQVSPW